jgi:hypothetical protein
VDDIAEDSARLSDAEFEQLKDLLRRYCAHDLDQWEAWRIEPAENELILITIKRAVPTHEDRDFYRSI